MQHTERARAKINLYLNVTARRNDGFHDIESVMQTIDVCDLLHFDVFPAKETEITLRFSEPCELPTDEHNLIVRAARAFLSAAGRSAKAEILLEKRIPMAAGLAGGSADAAATLRAFNALMPGCVTTERLYEIAASLGSDVPFCLKEGRALCTGRGEILESLPIAGKGYFGVLANTDEASSTPSAYKRLDEIYHNFDGGVSCPKLLAECGVLDEIKRGALPPFYNIFEEVVLPLCPRAAEAKVLLLAMGAEASMMSGSGPSVFALTKDEALQEKMSELLTARGYLVQKFSF